MGHVFNLLQPFIDQKSTYEKVKKDLGRALPPPSLEQNPKEQQLFSSLSQFNQTMPTPVPPSIVCAKFDRVKCQVKYYV